MLPLTWETVPSQPPNGVSGVVRGRNALFRPNPGANGELRQRPILREHGDSLHGTDILQKKERLHKSDQLIALVGGKTGQ